MPLSDTRIKNAKPKTKQYKLFDGNGLYLLVMPSGGKSWRMKYRFEGKEKTLTFGLYPEVPLRKKKVRLADEEVLVDGARDKCEAARELIAAGIDPGAAKKSRNASGPDAKGDSFETVAREWHQKFLATWTEKHSETIIRRLENHVFPWIGKMQIGDISAADLLPVLERLENKKVLETAHRVKTICGQVFRYAVATSRAKRDVAADLKDALPSAYPTPFASITDPDQVAILLNDIDEYEGFFVVKSALMLAPLVFQRPGELRSARWEEFDLEAREWKIPVERLKLGKKEKIARKGEKHLVPLSEQAVAILKELYPLTGRSDFVFPGHRSKAKPISDNALNAALRSLGYSKEQMTAHGFRAMARTILDEILGFRPDIIEHQLAHKVKGPLGRAYNRTKHVEERKKMMQEWADYLDGLKASKGR